MRLGGSFRWLWLASLSLLWACGVPTSTPSPSPLTAQLALTSSAFTPGATIPVEHTCDGADRSPPLAWSEPPPGTASLALLVEDPDAPGGTFIHWLLYELPAHTRSVAAGIPPLDTLPDGARQGRNDFGTLGYRGPCPPPGRSHRYVFRLYALDRPTGLAPGATRDQFLRAIEGHILATGELVGIYGR
ncbi:Putative lipoprotein LppC [bacterium HR28]|uniref:YbhB/YbcL family Raf kinase inhibitor-like protein n=1 Tax=Thermomicrobium roseum TaxID=500 RepID=A0A7C1XK24_THERO|nr:Putative lipoprotein LppC [bacterium HR28]